MAKPVKTTKATSLQKMFMTFFFVIVIIMLFVVLLNDFGIVKVQNSEMYRQIFYSSLTLIGGYLFGSNTRVAF